MEEYYTLADLSSPLCSIVYNSPSKMSVRYGAVTVLVFVLTAPAWAQQGEKKEREPSDSIVFDFSFDYDPEELREHIMDKLQWKRIWGPFGIAGYHIAPAAESGPYRGPPTQFWSNGFGTSLWRDTVTGWPLQ